MSINAPSASPVKSTQATAHRAPSPVHVPSHPVNTEPSACVALSVTAWPALNCALHVAPHVMPAGTLATLPAPDPLRDTATVTADAPTALRMPAFVA